MAAIWRSVGSSPQITDLQAKREGRPNLEELWWKNGTTSLRSSFQSQVSTGSENELGYSSEDSSRKTSSEYCPATPAQCESPSIEQFYFGMDNESPTLAIGSTTAKGIDGVLVDGMSKPQLPIRGQPQMLASLTSFLDSQHDHYAAAMNAANLDHLDDYEDDVFDSEYEDYEDESSDDDFEYATIEIASIVAYSRPVLRPKLLHLRPSYVQRTPSAADSASKYSDSSSVSKLYSQYSWSEEVSSNGTEHDEAMSEDEFHDTSPSNDLDECKPLAEEESSSPRMDETYMDDGLMSNFTTISPALKLRFSMEQCSPDGPNSALYQRLSTPVQATSDVVRVVNIPSRSSSKLQAKPTKQKSPVLRRSGGRYSIFPLRSH